MKEILYLSHLSEGAHSSGLTDFSLTVFAGQCVCLVGIHGSGKSRVKMLLNGKLTPSSGDIYLHEKKATLSEKTQFERAGIRLINSQQALVGTMSICDNLFLLNENKSRKFFYDRRAAERETASILREYLIDHLPTERINRLSLYEQSLLCIAKAASRGASLLVMDMAGTFFSEEQLRLLGEHITRLKKQGISFLIIEDDSAHFLEQADRVIIMQDGKDVKTFYSGAMNYPRIARYLKVIIPPAPSDALPPDMLNERFEKLLRIRQNGEQLLTVSPGEIIGVFDTMQDVGRNFQDYLYKTAKVNHLRFESHAGRDLLPHTGADAVYIPADSAELLLETLPIGDNLILPARSRTASPSGLISRTMRRYLADDFFQLAGIPGNPKNVLTLSYAHRKLLSIYRWALARPALLLLESPDAGLDGNARNQLQRYLSQLSQEGIVILVTEHSFPVLQTQCDHILLFEDGANLTIHHRAR